MKWTFRTIAWEFGPLSNALLIVLFITVLHCSSETFAGGFCTGFVGALVFAHYCYTIYVDYRYPSRGDLPEFKEWQTERRRQFGVKS